MRFEIKHRPSYSLLEVGLEQGEAIRAEAGAMTYMSPNIQVKTVMREASFIQSLGLKILGGQSFFVNEYMASGGTGLVGLVSAPLGDIARLEVRPGLGYIVQKAAYVASTPKIDLDIKWQGFTRGLFGQGLFMLRATGS
ncbi:MAG: AIM24 family protein, partial [Nitrososphaerota archaeon]